MSFALTARRVVLPLLPERWKRHIKTALFDVPDTEISLRRMRRLGFDPHVVIDIGAYVGDWTRTCKRIFPNARVLMIEPQPAKVAVLSRVVADLRNVEF